MRRGRACAGTACVTSSGGLASELLPLVADEGDVVIARAPAEGVLGGTARVALNLSRADVRLVTPHGARSPRTAPVTVGATFDIACVLPPGAALRDRPGGDAVGVVEHDWVVKDAVATPQPPWHATVARTAWGTLSLWADCAEGYAPDDPDGRIVLARLDAAGTIAVWDEGACSLSRWSRTGPWSGVLVDEAGDERAYAWSGSPRASLADGQGALTMGGPGYLPVSIGTDRLEVFGQVWLLDDRSCATRPIVPRESPPLPDLLEAKRASVRPEVSALTACGDHLTVDFSLLSSSAVLVREADRVKIRVASPEVAPVRPVRGEPSPWLDGARVVWTPIAAAQPVPDAVGPPTQVRREPVSSRTTEIGNRSEPATYTLELDAPAPPPGPLDLTLAVDLEFERNGVSIGRAEARVRQVLVPREATHEGCTRWTPWP